jgi:glycerol-3-phosphate dehydrogenase subunit C
MMGGRNSLPRKMMQAVTGVAAARELPKYAAQRFSDWFRKYFSGKKQDRSNGSVALFPTCMVEYQNPGIGKDAARVMERNHIGCDLPDGLQCCGMPHLDIGNLEAFRAQAGENARILARQVRQGKEIVALQPTCAYTLKHEYPAYLKTEDARLVGEHTQDVGEYLMGVHRAEGKGLDTNFTGKVEENISWHIPCHLKAQNIGFKSRDLMRLTGAKVTLVDKCAGIDGGWGLRAENYEAAHKIAVPMVNAIEKAGHSCVAGDCSLANGVIAEETGKVASHPVQVLARAYGIPKED